MSPPRNQIHILPQSDILPQSTRILPRRQRRVRHTRLRDVQVGVSADLHDAVVPGGRYVEFIAAITIRSVGRENICGEDMFAEHLYTEFWARVVVPVTFQKKKEKRKKRGMLVLWKGVNRRKDELTYAWMDSRT